LRTSFPPSIFNSKKPSGPIPDADRLSSFQFLVSSFVSVSSGFTGLELYLSDFYIPHQDIPGPVLVDCFFHPTKARFDVYRIGRECTDGEGRSLVEILMVDLGHEDLVAASDPFNQRPGVAPLGLEVSRFWDMKLESPDSDIERDIHNKPPVSL